MKKTPLIILVISLLLLSLLVIFLFFKPKDQVVNEEPEVIPVTEDGDTKITEIPLVEDPGTEVDEIPPAEDFETETVETVVYRNEKYNLTFEYFEDWQIIESEDLNEIRLSKEYEIPDDIEYYSHAPDTIILDLSIKDNPYNLRAYEFECLDFMKKFEKEIMIHIDEGHMDKLEVTELEEKILQGVQWEPGKLRCPPYGFSFTFNYSKNKKIEEKDVYVFSTGTGQGGVKYLFNLREHVIKIGYLGTGRGGYPQQQISEMEEHLEEIVKSIEFLSN